MTRTMVRGGSGVLSSGGSAPDRQPYAIPTEMQDEVEKWARQSGRHATVVWKPPPLACFAVEIDLRPSDERLKAWQEGDLEEKPKELVYLHRWDGEEGRYEPIHLHELGTQGLLTHLRRGDTWSGRGKFDSIQEAVQHSIQSWKDRKEKMRERARDRAIQKGLSVRRQVCGIPFEKVGIDLGGFSTEQEQSESVETD